MGEERDEILVGLAGQPHPPSHVAMTHTPAHTHPGTPGNSGSLNQASFYKVNVPMISYFATSYSVTNLWLKFILQNDFDTTKMG